ncbi:MAG: hypothetical protein HQL56_16485 [Magnetococcales bacterium]|nr:hypothetical protein [Magnetococcales bacterium]
MSRIRQWILYTFLFFSCFAGIGNEFLDRLEALDDSSPEETLKLFLEADYYDIRFVREMLTQIDFTEDSGGSPDVGCVLCRPSEYDNCPIAYIGGYALVDCEVDGDQGDATVVYQRVAVSSGIWHSRKFELDYQGEERVWLQLVREENKWRIVDPKMLHNSLSYFKKRYLKEIAEDVLRARQFKRYGHFEGDPDDNAGTRAAWELVDRMDRGLEMARQNPWTLRSIDKCRRKVRVEGDHAPEGAAHKP